MNDTADVVVIGGGAIGISAAYYLSQAGRDVLVLEKGEVCSGSSYGNAGLIVPSHSVPLAEPGVIGQALRWMFKPDSPFYIKPRLDPALWSWLVKFARACNERQVERAMPILRDMHFQSLTLYDELAALPELQFGLQTRGRLLLFNTEEGFAHGIAEAQHMSSIGVESEVLDRQAVEQREPNVHRTIVGGLFYAQDAHLVPDRFVCGLAALLESNGVSIRTSTGVTGFGITDGRISVVDTTQGSVHAQEVVIAGGSWSSRIAKPLGIRLPIQPAKGYSITAARPDGCPETPTMLSEAKVAVTPLGDTVRFAGTLEMTGMDLRINQRRVDAILNAVPQYLPGLDPARLDVIETWCGLRPCSPDGLPFLGRSSRFDNLTIAAGHAMIGISTAPITGKLVSELVARRPTSVDLELMRVERFA